MRDKQRPVVLTIEQHPHIEPNRNGDMFPAGYPIVTKMRSMTKLEHICHELTTSKLVARINKLLNVGSNKKTIKAVTSAKGMPTDLNIGVQISEEQYNKLIRGENTTISAIKYLRGETPAYHYMELVRPPRFDAMLDSGDYAV